MGDSKQDRLVLLYVPCGSEEEAARLGMVLVEGNLIACANIYASRSLYRWQGRLADEAEWLLLCKTLASREDAARGAIEKLHSYDVPCILTLEPGAVNEPYLSWVVGELGTSEQVAPGATRA